MQDGLQTALYKAASNHYILQDILEYKPKVRVAQGKRISLYEYNEDIVFSNELIVATSLAQHINQNELLGIPGGSRNSDLLWKNSKDKAHR